MAKRITVTALQPLHYEGRSHVPGSVFTASPVDAASLKYRRKVRLGGQLSGGTVPEHPSITRRMEPVEGFRASASSAPEQPPSEPVDDTAQLPSAELPGDSHPTEPASTPARGRRGRTYQRRDMVAEPPTE